jgi:hypothetical protein
MKGRPKETVTRRNRNQKEQRPEKFGTRRNRDRKKKWPNRDDKPLKSEEI